MPFELFFIYDTHCPWSYRAASLVNQIHLAFPKVNLHLLHVGYFDGNQQIQQKQLTEVTNITGLGFNESYLKTAEINANSVLSCNLMAWACNRAAKQSLDLLNALFIKHFENGAPLDKKQDIEDILDTLKLSPPAKALRAEKHSKDAEASFYEIDELQGFIGTDAIPAILIGIGENLILLNHNLYLNDPKKIVDAVNIELTK